MTDDKGDSFVSNGGGNEGTDVERKPTSAWNPKLKRKIDMDILLDW